MASSIEVDGYPEDDLPIIVVRTDYSDDEAWSVLLEELTESQAGGTVEVRAVTGSAWAGADIDQVLAALPDVPPPAVFIADAAAMRTDGHASGRLMRLPLIPPLASMRG